ncbi:MAG TPA: hypothetical protein VGL54_05790 [Solirubrobacteraceae bacterium]|jgi:hypothetical protein
MNAVRDFFSSLREDLLGKRLLPYLVVLAVALVAAVGYAVLGGGSSTPAPTPVAASAPAGASAAVGDVTVSQAPANPNQPVSETTEGTSKQHHGVAHDPFKPLPGAKSASSSTTASNTTSASSGSSSTSAPSSSSPSPSSSGGTTPTTPNETTPAKPKLYVHFHVTAQLGVVPPVAEGATPQPAQLKTYKDMALDEPLPDKANPQLVFLGVVLRTGKEALFGLTGAAILHGSASCQPSATQCQAIDLQVGQSETLEVLEADGSTVTYELKLASIDKSVSTASTARVRDAFRTQAKAARELARRAPKLSELRYSPWGGGFVFAGHPAFAAQAHAAWHHRR